MAEYIAFYYNELIDISQGYLGPATERFIDRQIATHLNKKPQELTAHDVASLVDWIKLAFSLLTNNRALIDAYTEQLKSLANRKQPESKITHANSSTT